MVSALLTPAVDGNNSELQVPSALPPEKVGLVVEWPPVLVLMDWLSSCPHFWC